MINFFNILIHYSKDIFPTLMIGFLISGIIHEFVPNNWINKHLGGQGIKGILWATFIGAIVPICCWGALPIAISFRKKGASLGSILALLVATPATSVTALIVTNQFFGLKFTIYIFFAVIIIGIVIGLVANSLNIPEINFNNKEEDSNKKSCCSSVVLQKSFYQRIISVLKFSYIDMPKDIGISTLIGIVLAALVASITPLSFIIKTYLTSGLDYVFASVFGLLTYMCATMGVPLVNALCNQGLGIGPSFVLLLVGPITSYGTILVLKKEFGLKVLSVYLGLIIGLAVIFGYLYTFL